MMVDMDYGIYLFSHLHCRMLVIEEVNPHENRIF